MKRLNKRIILFAAIGAIALFSIVSATSIAQILDKKRVDDIHVLVPSVYKHIIPYIGSIDISSLKDAKNRKSKILTGVLKARNQLKGVLSSISSIKNEQRTELYVSAGSAFIFLNKGKLKSVDYTETRDVLDTLDKDPFVYQARYLRHMGDFDFVDHPGKSILAARDKTTDHYEKFYTAGMFKGRSIDLVGSTEKICKSLLLDLGLFAKMLEGQSESKLFSAKSEVELTLASLFEVVSMLSQLKAVAAK